MGQRDDQLNHENTKETPMTDHNASETSLFEQCGYSREDHQGPSGTQLV